MLSVAGRFRVVQRRPVCRPAGANLLTATPPLPPPRNIMQQYIASSAIGLATVREAFLDGNLFDLGRPCLWVILARVLFIRPIIGGIIYYWLFQEDLITDQLWSWLFLSLCNRFIFKYYFALPFYYGYIITVKSNFLGEITSYSFDIIDGMTSQYGLNIAIMLMILLIVFQILTQKS